MTKMAAMPIFGKNPSKILKAHKFIGELIVYTCSGVRPASSYVRRRRTSSTILNIFSKTPCSIKAKFYVEYPLERGMKICSRHFGHMTKMAATPIYGKNLSKIFFSGTGRPISTKPCMKHPRLLPIIVCSNDDPGMTLTYFTARSNLVT